MKKIITICAVALVVGVSAQEKKMDRKNASIDRMEIFENLNLTEQQKTEIRALFESEKAEYKNKREKSSFTAKEQKVKTDRKKREFSEAEKAEFKAKRDAKFKERDAKIQSILTAEQYKEFLAEREKRQAEKQLRKKSSDFKRSK
ncbi:MAG: hypothetical protein GX159_00085 [Flavobacteriaceae bacterium]|jgi:Spy/CpxP family protein refolding chaperone|nr:hypothetical protein [Flavobacteriaceae bacterium]